MGPGKYGWIKPTVPIEHPMADRHKGHIYVSTIDLQGGLEALTVGTLCQFHLFEVAITMSTLNSFPNP